jgi:lysophospholipase L1-like esterase
MARREVDLGPVDAYAIAVEEGYTGTREEWVQAMADAEANGLKAEGYATGKQKGTAVESGEYFENNAKYYSEQAQSASVDAGLAKAAAEIAKDAAETAAERDTAAWLNEHITNPDSPPLDRTLSFSSAAAPADMVGSLNQALKLDNVNNPGIWELGNIGMSSGNNTSANPNTRMRTIGFLSDNIASISKLSGDYVLYAYEGDTYIGHWNGTGFDTTTSVATLTNVDLSAIKSTYPTYKYRLVWYQSGSYTPTPSTDYVNIVLHGELYAKLNGLDERVTAVESDVDGFSVGSINNSDMWESGQIGTSSGNNGTSASRMRTIGYLPECASKISATTGKFVLLAYDPTAQTPYIGVWTGSGFETSTTYSSLSEFDLAPLKTQYPNYQYRLMWYLSSSYTPVPATDYANVVIENEKTAIAHGVTLNGAKIVNMGDSIFGLHFAPVDISTFISQATGATCYNCAFPGTRAVTRSENIGKKKFDLTTLVDAIISGDYSEQDAVREAATGSTDYDHLPTLESVDFSTVDIITLSYGTNDYGGDVVIGAAENGNASTFIGAMQEAIGKLEAAFPQARIFVCAPIYRSWHDADTYVNADTRENANGDTLLDFVEAVGMISKAEYVPEIDNHYIGINAATRTVYTTDGTHPNESGRRLIARHMAKELF